MKEVFFSSSFLSVGVALVIFIFAAAFDFSPVIALLFFAIFFVFTFYAGISRPVFNSLKAKKMIESEIVSMIRFLVLEIKTERSIFYALENTAKNYSVIGIYLDEIVDKVKLGKTLEQSLGEAVEICPSDNLRNVYWQLLNSLQTGADISSSLKVLLVDIVEEQKIKIEEYGRELNALSLFYMMIAIIIPTVGFTIVAAILTFIGFEVPLGLLITIWIILSLVQYFFLMLSSQRRPSVEAY